MSTSKNVENTPYWKLAKDGISLFLNNKEKESENLFKKHEDNTKMYAGYATCLFMEALMTFEEDKLNFATKALKETERRSTTSNWSPAKSSSSFDLGNSYIEHLEMQIIRADSEMCLATLAFLRQDFSGYFKGGWILRKSWKHYHQAYTEISSIYKNITGTSVTNLDIQSSRTSVDSANSINTVSTTTIPAVNSHHQIVTHGYIPKSVTMHFPPPSAGSQPSCSNNNTVLKKSVSVNSSLSQLQQGLSRFSSFNSHLSLFGNLNPFGGEGIQKIEVDRESIMRLMCAVSFGYGLIQLGLSLLPPSALRLTALLGFHGNRKIGLASLVVAMHGDDMRAPLATLALLWYHTIVRPFFALDGHNVQAGVEIASKLIHDAMKEYSASSIFLFFKGRVDRLKSDIPAAIESFNTSIANANQREIKILSGHEVGWCYLISLDYSNSSQTFKFLISCSRWSDQFYGYLCLVSDGANDSLQKRNDLTETVRLITFVSDGSQLHEFLLRRFKICPKSETGLKESNTLFWKMLAFELLYLWNALPSCSVENINTVIEVCDTVENGEHEPFLGLANLMKGSAHCILKNYDIGIECFRRCLERRSQQTTQSEDLYISAFALYELGHLLITDATTIQEGKQCLQQVLSYKGYDFEQRLSVRVHSMLKHV